LARLVNPVVLDGFLERSLHQCRLDAALKPSVASGFLETGLEKKSTRAVHRMNNGRALYILSDKLGRISPAA
jgi:hypothetical protein